MRTGDPEWDVELEIRLFRIRENTNRLTRSIRGIPSMRASVPPLDDV